MGFSCLFFLVYLFKCLRRIGRTSIRLGMKPRIILATCTRQFLNAVRVFLPEMSWVSCKCFIENVLSYKVTSLEGTGWAKVEDSVKHVSGGSRWRLNQIISVLGVLSVRRIDVHQVWI